MVSSVLLENLMIRETTQQDLQSIWSSPALKIPKMTWRTSQSLPHLHEPNHPTAATTWMERERCRLLHFTWLGFYKWHAHSATNNRHHNIYNIYNRFTVGILSPDWLVMAKVSVAGLAHANEVNFDSYATSIPKRIAALLLRQGACTRAWQ